MNIKRVELIANGFKGANVHILTNEFRNNRPFLNEIIKKNKNPIHMDMEKLFKDLRIHLLDVCKVNNIRLSEAEKKMLILETDVTSIEFDNDSFLISGEMEVFEDKKIKIKTCKVQESDGYEGYHEVRGLIEALKVEAISYVDGMKIVSDREMMLRWLEAKKDHNMSKEQFEALDEQGQKEYMDKTMRSKFGADIDLADEEEEQEEEPQAIDIDNEVIDVPEKKEKKSKKQTEPNTSF